jgi:hypothetical protein
MAGAATTSAAHHPKVLIIRERQLSWVEYAVQRLATVDPEQRLRAHSGKPCVRRGAREREGGGYMPGLLIGYARYL